MKANELMIEDWVYNKNIDKPMQVYPMMFSQMFRRTPNATTEDYNIFPIPLTPEILEKQGEQKPQRMISAEAKEAMYDKPAWSEKDEQHIDSLLKRLDGLCRNEFERTRFAISEDEDWLKSLKVRI